MKLLKRILAVIIVFLVLGIIAVLIYVRHLGKRGLPDYNAEIMSDGVTETVEIIRDQYGIPHIYAKNEQDLYFVTGYLTAQDRLWQMDLLRRVTTGRLSEIFGDDYIDVDMLLRALRIPEKSEMVLESTGPDMLRALGSYAEGVNAYIQDKQNSLPLEFGVLGYEPEPWEVIHSANLIGYMAWNLTMPWAIEMRLYRVFQEVGDSLFKEFLPTWTEADAVVFPDLKADLFIEEGSFARLNTSLKQLGLSVFSGSNNWAVSADRAAAGMPIVCNDMHLELTRVPGIWCQMHQVVEDRLNVTGLILPGAPFMIVGHNDSIAWGMTNVMVDDMDFYLETTHPEDSNLYRFNGEWREMEVREEKIVNSKGDTAIRYNSFTHRGPVVNHFHRVRDRTISMQWIGNEYSNELRSIYLVNRASNWNEFRNAMSTFIAISQNVVYADVQGNIGLQTCAGVPLRERVMHFVAPGDTDLYDWKGMLPFEELPYSYNPSSGYVSSANNQTTDSTYPHYISYWFDLPYRIVRIRELLEAKEKLGIEDMKKIQADQVSVLSRKLLSALIPVLDTANLDPVEDRAKDLMKSWNADLERESGAALLAEQLYLDLIHVVIEDELPEELFKSYMEKDLLPSYVIHKILENGGGLLCDDRGTDDRVESFADNLLAAFRLSVDRLGEQFGSDPGKWNWGDVHTITFSHPLASVPALDKAFGLSRGPYPAGGSFHTVSSFSYDLNKPFASNHGASHRNIFTPCDWDKSITVIPTGVSGIPASDHYCDQTGMYMNYEYHPEPFSRNMVESFGVYRSVIKPK